MTERKELLIPFKDLLNLVLKCRCGAEITIDFATEEPRKMDWEHKVFRCSVCNADFDSNVRLGFADFIRWQTRVEASGQSVFFRVSNSN
jgi:hypothetical protein